MSGLFTDATELTRDYHQTVLRLTHEFPTTQVAWDVSQHVLDRLWKSSGVAGSTSASESAGTNTTHACQGCGHHLYPGSKGTTMRVKRPTPFSSPAAKRTVRRREQRKRRKAIRNEAMNARDTQATRRRSSTFDTHSPTATATTTSTTSSASAPRLMMLSDDPGVRRLVRNHLVLSCGRCRDKTFLKGLRRTPHRSKPTAIASQSYRPKAPASLASTPGASNDNGDLSEEFVSVPKLSKTKPPPPPLAATVHKPVKRLSLLQQKMQGKKKKKKPANKSSHMLDFLSSLNDH